MDTLQIKKILCENLAALLVGIKIKVLLARGGFHYPECEKEIKN